MSHGKGTEGLVKAVPQTLGVGPRQVTIFFSDIVGSADLTERVGDQTASTVINRILGLQKEIIERDGRGRVLRLIGDAVMAVFDTPSVAMTRALQIQAALHRERDGDSGQTPALRVGLHMGEVLLEEDDRLEIVSRHLNRAHRVMEAGGGGQILTSRAVAETGGDFVEGVPPESLAIRHYGEYYLKGVGPTDLCELADLRIREPEAPCLATDDQDDSSVLGRLRRAGYTDVERIGEGAFGVVYRARQSGTGRAVAVKVLNGARSSDRDSVDRFRREARNLGQLTGAGFADIIDQHLERHPPFIVTELIEGKPIDELVAGDDAEGFAKVFLSICEILGTAHAAGVIHCDLKPSNILLRQDLTPVILDFGISVLASEQERDGGSTSTIVGTPTFLAPEQIKSGPVGPATDVYALGVLMYRILAGTDPFPGDTIHEILDGHLYQDPPLPSRLRPDVDDRLQRICLKAMEKSPDDRYGSVQEMADDLRRVLRGDVVVTRPTCYDNLLYHRARKHAEQVRCWSREGLLSNEERDRLLASYDGLLRRGVVAVMESRRLRPWLVLTYVGGWIATNAAVLWTTLHWSELIPWQRLLLGSTPAVFGAVTALVMQHLKHFRLLFVALVVCVLATPLFSYVWIHELDIGANLTEQDHSPETEVLPWMGEDTIANRQLLMISLVTLGIAAAAVWRTGTTTHSAQCAVTAALFYVCLMFWLGLKVRIDREEYATAALWFVPLLGGAAAAAVALVRSPTRTRQGVPWIYLAVLVSICLGIVIPRFMYSDWFNASGAVSDSLAWITTSAAGVLSVFVGCRARGFFGHRGRVATMSLILAGGVMLWLGLYQAGCDWPDDWPFVSIFERRVAPTRLLMPLAGLALAMVACNRQMLLLMILGLGEIGVSIYLLGYEHFDDVQQWPAMLLVIGSGCYLLALCRELRNTRGHATDDVILRTRL